MPDNLPERRGVPPMRPGHPLSQPNQPDDVGLVFKVGVRANHDPFSDEVIKAMIGRKAEITAQGRDFTSEVTDVRKQSAYEVEMHITVWVPREYEHQWGVLLDSLGQIVTASGQSMTGIAVDMSSMESATRQVERNAGVRSGQSVHDREYVPPDQARGIPRKPRKINRYASNPGHSSERIDHDDSDTSLFE